MIVIDASVATKWFLPEADSEQAAALLETNEKLFAPELIRIEVASAIARRARLRELPPAHAVAACSAWQQGLDDGVVTLTNNELDLRRAVELAIELAHPLQDCLYLATAQRLGMPLITADGKFRTKALSVYARIHLPGTSS